MERQLTQSRALRRAFTLVEMIGVLAIMAILAAAAVPVTLRTIDRTATRVEMQHAAKIGDAVRLYYRHHAAAPRDDYLRAAADPYWYEALRDFSDLGPQNMLRTPRQIQRTYIVDRSTTPIANPRVLVLSTVHRYLALPTAGNINSGSAAAAAQRFRDIWDTPPGQVPPTTSWPGWSAWHNTADSADLLVIERVNLVPIYENEVKSITITLNNPDGATTPQFELLRDHPTNPNTHLTVVTRQSINGTPPLSTVTGRPGDHLRLYLDSNASSSPSYTYTLSSRGAPDVKFEGGRWHVQYP